MESLAGWTFRGVAQLQRGRAFEGAEMHEMLLRVDSIEKLQRGRAFEGAEMYQHTQTPNMDTTQASTGPRL